MINILILCEASTYFLKVKFKTVHGQFNDFNKSNKRKLEKNIYIISLDCCCSLDKHRRQTALCSFLHVIFYLSKLNFLQQNKKNQKFIEVSREKTMFLLMVLMLWSNAGVFFLPFLLSNARLQSITSTSHSIIPDTSMAQ